MPTIQRLFKVFVASPSDLQPEREALETAIAELNQTVGNTLGLRLELLRWETLAHPAVGSDPQMIVNEQLGDDFDIFIGILWCRFGQATPRAESGTLEEFERAYERFRGNPEALEIMFYFKDAPIPPSRIDVDQLSKVQQFRSRLESKGLVGTFSSTDEFLKAIRIHLTRVLQSWDQRVANPEVTQSAEVLPTEPPVVCDDEPGFLDLIELGNENFDLTGSAASRIATYIEELGAASVETSERLGSLDMKTSAGVASAKRIVNAMAERLYHFAEKLRADIPIMRETFGKAISSVQSAAELLPDFQGNPSANLEENIEMLRSLESTIKDTRENIGSLRHSVEGAPRMTTQYNRAKRHAQEALAELEVTLDEQLRLVTEASRLQEALLRQYSKDA